MSAADPSSSSTPEAASEVQADSHTAEAGVGEGEGGAGEGQQGSHEEEVVEGGSGAGVPVIKPAPVYNKEGVVVEVTQDIVDAVDKFTPPAGFVRAPATSPTCTRSGCMWSTRSLEGPTTSTTAWHTQSAGGARR